MLRRRHQVHVVMPGFNNRIGSDRIHGIFELTEQMAVAEVHTVKCPYGSSIAHGRQANLFSSARPPSSRRPGPEISSSAIRKAIALGDMNEAAEMLGACATPE